MPDDVFEAQGRDEERALEAGHRGEQRERPGATPVVLACPDERPDDEREERRFRVRRHEDERGREEIEGDDRGARRPPAVVLPRQPVHARRGEQGGRERDDHPGDEGRGDKAAQGDQAREEREQDDPGRVGRRGVPVAGDLEEVRRVPVRPHAERVAARQAGRIEDHDQDEPGHDEAEVDRDRRPDRIDPLLDVVAPRHGRDPGQGRFDRRCGRWFRRRFGGSIEARCRRSCLRDQPFGSTTIVTSGVIPANTLIATLYVPSDLSGSSRSTLWRSTSMPRRASASAMSLDVIEP